MKLKLKHKDKVEEYFVIVTTPEQTDKWYLIEGKNASRLGSLSDWGWQILHNPYGIAMDQPLHDSCQWVHEDQVECLVDDQQFNQDYMFLMNKEGDLYG